MIYSLTRKTPYQVCHSVVRADPQVGVGDIYRIVGRVGGGWQIPNNVYKGGVGWLVPT